MRIALTIHALYGGGAERVLARLADRWAVAGHELHVITWSAADTDEIAMASAMIRRHGLNLMGGSTNLWQAIKANVRRVRALRQKLRQLQPDLVLSFCDQMNISTLQAARGLNLPVWIAERSDPSHQRLSPLWELWRRRTYPRCTGCVAQTANIAQYLSQWIPANRIEVIPNAIEPVTHTASSSPAPPNPPHSSADDSISSDSPPGDSPHIVLSVGRLSPEKGIDNLLVAWQQAHSQMPGWELRIVGDGTQRVHIESQAAKLPRVHIMGWLDEPAQLYRTADIFVLPSRYEGFPNALLEAMSYGLACLSTNCSQAITQLSDDGQALTVVSASAESLAEQLASGLVKLAADAERRQQLGAAAHRVSLEYNWNRIGPQWDRLLAGRLLEDRLLEDWQLGSESKIRPGV